MMKGADLARRLVQEIASVKTPIWCNDQDIYDAADHKWALRQIYEACKASPKLDADLILERFKFKFMTYVNLGRGSRAGGVFLEAYDIAEELLDDVTASD